MPPSDFAKANIDEILSKLTTDEAIELIGGVGFWHTFGIPRLGIPAIKVSDGPNGVRGNNFFMGTPAKALPSSTALGATFDVELVETVGLKLLASEAKLRAASVLLAPTCNIQRNPRGGRAFESFSEDPHHSGMITAAYIKGVQGGGIATTIKHFVGNDKENDRMAYDSIIPGRPLREIYLMPFMLAQKYAKPWSYMTAYNRVNGTHVSENPDILQGILRDDWKFDGLVMSDWFGVYSIDHSINAGLDLEMPGTNKWRSVDLVSRSIGSRKIARQTVLQRARKVLELVKKCCEGCPEIIDGDRKERTHEGPEDTALLRRVAAESIVLLKNDKGLLPLKASSFPTSQKKKIAIVGGNAKQVVLSGGGSAALKPSYFISPYDGILKALKELEGEFGEVEVTYGEGATTYLQTPTLDYSIFTPEDTPRRGWLGTWYTHESDDSMTPVVNKPFKENHYIDETRCFFSAEYPRGLTKRWTLKLRGNLSELEEAEEEEWEFGLCSAGRAKLYIDDQLVIDNWTTQRRGDAFFGLGSEEERGRFTKKRGVKHQVVVEFCNVRAPAPESGDLDEAVMDSNPAVRLGGTPVSAPDTLISSAVALAKEADIVIAVVGINADWETEGYDRSTLALPGRTDELVQKVAEVNDNVVVVTQAGSSILMPWSGTVRSIIHAWYLGNPTGDAIADVLFGRVNPSAKLSVSFPKREEDVVSFGAFEGSEGGRVRYGEGLYVGYKHHHHRNLEPLFAYGYGLSYTTFKLSNLQLSKPAISPSSKEFSLTASATVTNTGSLTGSEVVQLYVGLPQPGSNHTNNTEFPHPLWQLRAFAKVKNLKAGKERKVELKLDKYAVSFWNDDLPRFGHVGATKGRFEYEGIWQVAEGEYGVAVGTSSRKEDLVLREKFVVGRGEGFEWSGL
ncbi:glycoside hydrolase family 3 protein [Marasmius fiardii PR-910]|nr:glycoside hydrolase family 3 protein [Marasmius fiardii PR-910]